MAVRCERWIVPDFGRKPKLRTSALTGRAGETRLKSSPGNFRWRRGVKIRRLIAALSAMLLCGWAARGQEGHHHELSEEEVGSVHFETTCGAGMSEAAKTEFDAKFNKAAALLHSFQYEDTRAAFENIAGENPQSAKADWGLAMPHFHGLWRSSDFAGGRTAIAN